MRNKKKNKYMLLLVLLLAVSIGYAALATTLKINGSASITKNTWSVYWSNVQLTSGSVTSNVPTIGNDTNGAVDTVVTWSTTLNLPGDFYEFTVDATNNGTIDAMITDIEDTVTPTLPSYIKYEVTYEDGTAIAENHLLPKKNGNTATTEKYKVRVEFLDTITPEQMNAIPEGGLSYTFTYGVTYSQATGDAIPRLVTCPSSACVYAFPVFAGKTYTDDLETGVRTYTYDANQWWFNDGIHPITENMNTTAVITTGNHQRNVLTAANYKTDYNEVIQESGKNYFIGMILDENQKIDRAFVCYKGDTVECWEGISSSNLGTSRRDTVRSLAPGIGFIETEYSTGKTFSIVESGPDGATQCSATAYGEVFCISINY